MNRQVNRNREKTGISSRIRFTSEEEYRRASLIRTQKGQSEVSVLERCPYKGGHYDNVTFDSTYSFKCSLAKTRLTLIFKLHLSLLIHSTKTLSFSSIQHCTSQLQTNYCFKTKRATAQCCM